MASGHLTRNMGSVDRAVRVFVVAPVAIVAALGLGASSVAGIVLFALAGIALATGASGFCLLYGPFGIDTRPKGGEEWQPMSRA